MYRVVPLTLFILLASWAGLFAQDAAIMIKLRRPQIGEKTRETTLETTTMKRTQTTNGKTQAQEIITKINLRFIEEPLEFTPGQRRPVKLKRTYEKAEQIQNGQTKELNLEGKTVLIQKAEDGTYTFTSDGKELTGLALTLLKREFDKSNSMSEEDYLPKKPVKVNDNWPVDAKKLEAQLAAGNFISEPNSAKAGGKLTSWSVKEGKSHGTLVLDFSLNLAKLKNPMGELPLKDSTVKMKMEMAGALDGSESALEGKLETAVELTLEQGPATIKISNTTTRSAKTEPVK